MKILQKTIAATATTAILLVSLALPLTVLAAGTKATPTPTEIPVPTVEPTIAPVTATPAPQSTSGWIMTHKKITLGILVVVAIAGYVIFRSGKKDKGSGPEEQSKPEEPETEEETGKEDQTPPENTV